MNQLKLISILLLVAAAGLAVACGGDDNEPKRTGIAQVDTVIDVVESRDREALRDMLQFTNLPCTDDAAVSDQPRCLGESSGTNVDVFQANECEANWLRRDNLDQTLDDILALEPVVYAAFEAPDSFYVAGRYAVVFEGDDPRIDEAGLKRYLSVGVEGDNGLITGVALGCGIDEPVHFLLPHLNEGFDDWLIEPEG